MTPVCLRLSDRTHTPKMNSQICKCNTDLSKIVSSAAQYLAVNFCVDAKELSNIFERHGLRMWVLIRITLAKKTVITELNELVHTILFYDLSWNLLTGR